MRRLWAIVVALAILVPTAHGVPVIDQQNTASPEYYWPGPGSTGTDYYPLQQEIVAGMDGTLVGIELMHYEAEPTDTCDLGGNLGPAWPSDAHDYQTTIYATDVYPTWTYHDLSAGNIILSAGDPFVISLENPTDVFDVLSDAENGSYSPGNFRYAGTEYPVDLLFRTWMDTWMEPDVIPEPATLGLLALGGLGLLRRRRRFAE